MATITSAELQKEAEAAEERLEELMDEDQLVDYWQDRLDTATATVEDFEAGGKGRTEAEKRFGKENKPRSRAGRAGRAEAEKRFRKGDTAAAEAAGRIQRSR